MRYSDRRKEARNIRTIICVHGGGSVQTGLFKMEELFIPFFMKHISEGFIKDCTRHREGRRQGWGGE